MTKRSRWCFYDSQCIGLIFLLWIYTVSRKRSHYNLAHDFAKHWPIFKIISLKIH